MKIGIIIALKKEIKILFKKSKKIKKIDTDINGINIYNLNINNKKIILAQCGIGKVSSSIATTVLIKLYKISYVINIGSAGALKKNIKLLSIIIANKTSQHDVNLKNLGYEIGVIPNLPQKFNTDKKFKNKIKKILFKSKIKFIEGLIVSGDQFINKSEKVKYILKNFKHALAVDMESASIMQVCYQLKKHCIIIKIISDYSCKEASHEFKKNIKNISNILYLIIEKIIKKIKFKKKK